MKRTLHEFAEKNPVVAMRLVALSAFLLATLVTGVSVYYINLLPLKSLFWYFVIGMLYILWSLYCLFLYSLWNEIRIKKHIEGIENESIQIQE